MGNTDPFFPFYLTLYVAQLILLPIITKDKWVCLLVCNTLYLERTRQVRPIHLWRVPRTVREPILSSRFAPGSNCDCLAVFNPRRDPSRSVVATVFQLFRTPARAQYRKPYSEIIWLLMYTIAT